VEENEMIRVGSSNRANKSAYGILIGKPNEKGPVIKPTCRWVSTIKKDFRDK
jgi:hypothetical protein